MIAVAPARIAKGALLQHVGRTQYRGQALHYGHDAENRYDSPPGTYGVLYLGQDLHTALMESVFHKHRWLADPSYCLVTRPAAHCEQRGNNDLPYCALYIPAYFTPKYKMNA